MAYTFSISETFSTINSALKTDANYFTYEINKTKKKRDAKVNVFT